MSQVRTRHLRLYWPETGDPGSRGTGLDDGDPPILPFRAFGGRFRSQGVINVVARARLIHANQRCRFCEHPVVEPIELDDGLLNRNDLPVPGTATLVGFHCESCGSEWPAG